jgi:hypothetical protein
MPILQRQKILKESMKKLKEISEIWVVNDGYVRPHNPHSKYIEEGVYGNPNSKINPLWADFEEKARIHTYATDSLNGSGNAIHFNEPEWQILKKGKEQWERFYGRVPSREPKQKNYIESLLKSDVYLRQFVKFNHNV